MIHRDRRCGNEVRNGNHVNGVCDISYVITRSYLTKFVSCVVIQSQQLHLIRSNDEKIGFRPSDSMSDVPGTMWGVM